MSKNIEFREQEGQGKNAESRKKLKESGCPQFVSGKKKGRGRSYSHERVNRGDSLERMKFMGAWDPSESFNTEKERDHKGKGEEKRKLTEERSQT